MIPCQRCESPSHFHYTKDTIFKQDTIHLCEFCCISLIEKLLTKKKITLADIRGLLLIK